MFPHTFRIFFILSCLSTFIIGLNPISALGESSTPSFAGWYRTRLERSPASDCESSAYPNSEIVLFLQIRQDKSKAFGDFCPASGIMKGQVSKGKLTITRSSRFGVKGEPLSLSSSKCPDRIFTEEKTVSMNQSPDNKHTFNIEYTITRKCITAEFSKLFCAEKFRGIGFFETHTVWPLLDSDPEKMDNTCHTAMQGCQSCHADYKNFIPSP